METLEQPPFRIDTEGVWYYFDTPLERLALVRLFYTVLVRKSSGFYLSTPVETVPILVEDAPFAVTSIETDGKGNITLTLNDQSAFPLDSERTLRISNANILYVSVFIRNETLFEARFTRRAYMLFAECLLQISENEFRVKSFGHEFVLNVA